MRHERKELSGWRQLVAAHPYWASVGAGVLLGVGFIWPLAWWVYAIGVVLLVWLLQRATTGYRAALYGGLALTVSAAGSLLWMWSVYPVEWMDVPQGLVQILFIGANWFTSALWIGLAGMFLGLAVWYIRGQRRVSALVAAPLIAALWVLTEVLGSILFSIFTLGGESFINARFSFSYLGYHLAQHDWLFHTSALGGVYILSFLAVLLPLLLWWAFYTYRAQAVYGAACLGLVIGLGYGTSSYMFLSSTPEQGIAVSVVETFFDGQARSASAPAALHASLRDAVSAAGEEQPDYVLLPEDARYLQRFANNIERRFVLDHQFGDSATILIDSGQVMTDDGLVLRGSVYDHATRDTYITDKQYLVPQGEYVPAVHATLARLSGYGAVVDTMREEIQYVPGPADQQISEIKAPALLFCFESASPYGVRQALAQQDHQAPFVAHPISHAWFHTPTQLWQQLDTMLRIQARWNNVPIISSGNQAPSRMYAPTGEIIAPDSVVSDPDGEWLVRRFTL